MVIKLKKAQATRLMLWALWTSLSVAAAVGLSKQMTNPKLSRQVFLPGKTTDGHYQIELSCASCHTEDFSDGEQFQAACVKCHAADLDEAQDSHPELKFTDPRNAKRVAQLDARHCITCHSEHQPSRTAAMGLSLPGDYCYRCHQDIGQDRSSHQGLPFDSCADAGCHNFHDNRSIYEDYLVKHSGEPAVLAQPFRVVKSRSNNQSCLSPQRATNNTPAAVESCKECHGAETRSWLSGRHGMRLSLALEAMRPGEARLPMEVAVKKLSLSCGSCHGGDPTGLKKEVTKDETWTEIDACLSCHNDEHSRAFKDSKHYELFVKEQQARVARGSGVTCATCHMPRSKDEDGHLTVNHNQNHNLRPNEKMIRTTCGNCHGLSFAIDAMADRLLIKNNFSGQPSAHVKSVDWAIARN